MPSCEDAKTADALGRYYSHTDIGKLLVSALPDHDPKGVLDLGVGEGALSLAATARWNTVDLVTVDVDSRASRQLNSQLRARGFEGTHRHIECDALITDLKGQITFGTAVAPSIGICNPPFQIPKWRKGFSEIVEDAGFSGSLPGMTDSALLFLSQNLRVLAAGGTLGIIVPDSLVSASKYLEFRKTLIEKYDVVQAIRLPRASFHGTAALAHILIVAKRRPTTGTIILSDLAARHANLESINVPRRQAAERLDYRYHTTQRVSPSGLTLADITLDLKRGSFNSAEAKNSETYILHTTGIKAQMRGQWIDFSAQKIETAKLPGKAILAEAGDILIGRVGRNMGEKLIGVSAGAVPITDCIYRVRVMPQYRERVMSVLASSAGVDWIAAHGCGVAASHLNRTDLLRLPIS